MACVHGLTGSTFSPVCVLCGHLLDGDEQVRVSIRLFRCQACGTWSSYPRVDATKQADIHDSGDYFEHPYFGGRRRNPVRTDCRCRDIFERMGAAVDTRSLRGHRLLDIGCDTGAFLESAARQFGVLPVGIDVSHRAADAAASAGIEAYKTTIETAPPHLAGFPAITAIDVIEHVVDPVGFLCGARRRLAPGGALYVETPNIRSAVYRLGRLLCRGTRCRPRALFERLFPPQHVQYFTVQGFERLAHQAGLEVVRLGTRVLPWADLAASVAVRAGLSIIQLADRLSGEGILIWAVLRRPVSEAGEGICR